MLPRCCSKALGTRARRSENDPSLGSVFVFGAHGAKPNGYGQADNLVLFFCYQWLYWSKGLNVMGRVGWPFRDRILDYLPKLIWSILNTRRTRGVVSNASLPTLIGAYEDNLHMHATLQEDQRNAMEYKNFTVKYVMSSASKNHDIS